MYICVGLVLGFRHIFKPRNVKCNIFSELTPKASLLFFSERNLLKLLPKNFAGKLKTEPNFVDKLCVEKYVFGKIRCEMKPETKLCVKKYFAWQSELCRKTLRWVFLKFWKYYAAYNSGLKIWLVSGIFEMAQLFNLKFCVYLCWLGAGFSPQFSSRETLTVI